MLMSGRIGILACLATALAAASLFADRARADDDDDGPSIRGFRGPSIGRIIPFIGNLPRFGQSGRANRRSRARPEIVVVGLSPDDRRELERRGYRVSASATSALLRAEIARIEAPPGVSLRNALRAVRTVAADAIAESNDLYRRHAFSRYRTAGQMCGERCEAFALTSWIPKLTQCSSTAVIGVIDTHVDASHPSLAGAKITVKSLRRGDRSPSDPAHGTGVVSLFVGQPGTPVVGIVPKAQVLAADAFHRVSRSDSADTFDLLSSLDWLSENGARIINMSLSGPANPVLEKAVRATLDRGITIVAAAGRPEGRNMGYPARYDGVLAVSAVDALLRPSRLSMRGAHVALAAPGVGLTVAGARDGLAKVDGTSFAAPFVTAALALQMGGGHAPAVAAERVTTVAKDLGAPGRDPVFGWGLVQYVNVPGCS